MIGIMACSIGRQHQDPEQGRGNGQGKTPRRVSSSRNGFVTPTMVAWTGLDGIFVAPESFGLGTIILAAA